MDMGHTHCIRLKVLRTKTDYFVSKLSDLKKLLAGFPARTIHDPNTKNIFRTENIVHHSHINNNYRFVSKNYKRAQ